jgi:hypothetical protein
VDPEDKKNQFEASEEIPESLDSVDGLTPVVINTAPTEDKNCINTHSIRDLWHIS